MVKVAKPHSWVFQRVIDTQIPVAESNMPTSLPIMPHVNRRNFLTIGASGLLGPLAGAALKPAIAAETPESASSRDPVHIDLKINGQNHHLSLDSRTTLLDMLRETLQLTGSKKGCDHGQCGACTIHVDGQRVLSCLTLAATLAGREVTTIEGLSASPDALHPMQQAFVDRDALQCGFCTPGQIMSAIGCVKEGHAATDENIREYMSGNICRCAAYPNIVAAIRQARTGMEG